MTEKERQVIEALRAACPRCRDKGWFTVNPNTPLSYSERMPLPSLTETIFCRCNCKDRL